MQQSATERGRDRGRQRERDKERDWELRTLAMPKAQEQWQMGQGMADKWDCCMQQQQQQHWQVELQLQLQLRCLVYEDRWYGYASVANNTHFVLNGTLGTNLACSFVYATATVAVGVVERTTTTTTLQLLSFSCSK